MKIFLDIGGHEGQTLSSVVDPKYSFDKIYVFEPVKALHTKLQKLAAGRPNVTLMECGLWNDNTTEKIYSPGTVAGSVFAAHNDVDEDDFVLCQFVNATDWFKANINASDEVYMKLNCEGAEADILFNLLESNEIFKIRNVMIDFDVRKVKGLEGLQQDVLDEFKLKNFTAYSLVDDVTKGPTQIVRIQSWLDTVHANKTDAATRVKQLFYWLKTAATGRRPGYSWELKHFIKAYTPLFILKSVGARRS